MLRMASLTKLGAGSSVVTVLAGVPVAADELFERDSGLAIADLSVLIAKS